jgi:hypothetical protein
VSGDQVKNAVEFFWRQAGQDEPFPRSLEAAAAWGLPVAIVKLPRLWIADIQGELQKCGISWAAPTVPTCLRGFMLAFRGKGFLFIDGSDPTAEQRYSLAHEIAHFLVDYYLPRLEAIEKLGVEIIAVLDGDREPTLRERVHAALSAAKIGAYEHIARREQLTTPEREDVADAVAVELLAPSPAIWLRIRGWVPSVSAIMARELLREVLDNEFGLPGFAASGVADALVARWWPRPPFREWLGIKK